MLKTTGDIKTNYYCLYCNKTYKLKSNVDKHMILCKLIHDNKKSKSKIEDDIDIPSQRNLYMMLLELGNKFNILEEKLEAINKYVIKKKKKIDVIDWLNNNISPIINFDKLTEYIILDDKFIEYILENLFIDAVINLFTKYICNSQIIKPIVSFIQKHNTFYIYVNQEVKWIQASKEDLLNFLLNIQQKIFRFFYSWKKEQIKIDENDDNLSIKYDKTTIKIVGTNFKDENIFNKIKNLMYSKLKTDIVGLLEYEFEF
jgi:hypothetical protein